MRQQNPNVDGFQRPTLGPWRNFNVVTSDFIQILHTGNSHWVCVSSIGCPEGQINLYDSLYNNIIATEVEEQVKSLLGGRKVKLLLLLFSSKEMVVTVECLQLHLPPVLCTWLILLLLTLIFQK